MSYMYRSRFLASPVVRTATVDDAEAIAEVIIQSNSAFITSVFRNKEKALKLLRQRHERHTEGIYVLTEHDEVIGVMKLHLPNKLYGNTISYIQLMKHLGIREGIRAGILLSHWDEYTIRSEEAFIEYLYIHQDWENFNGRDLLLEHALQEASLAGALYITNFIPVTDYREIGNFENRGFILRRKIHSPLAKLFKATYTAWYRATYSLTNQPITVKEKVAEKVDNVRLVWQQKRKEILGAMRLVLALTAVPIIGATLAYRADSDIIIVILWGLLGITHLFGVRFYLKGSSVWRYGLIITMLAEGINLLSRVIFRSIDQTATVDWFNRFWLITTALTTFWIASVLIRNPNVTAEPTISHA